VVDNERQKAEETSGRRFFIWRKQRKYHRGEKDLTKNGGQDRQRRKKRKGRKKKQQTKKQGGKEN